MESPCNFLFRKLEEQKDPEHLIDQIQGLKADIFTIEREFIKYIYLLALQDFDKTEGNTYKSPEQFYAEYFDNDVH